MFLLPAYCCHLLLLFFSCCYWRFAVMSLYFLIAPISYLYCFCLLHFARHQPTFLLSSQVTLTKKCLKICIILSFTVKSGCVSTWVDHSPIIILTMCVDQRIAVVPIFYLDKDQNLTTLYLLFSSTSAYCLFKFRLVLIAFSVLMLPTPTFCVLCLFSCSFICLIFQGGIHTPLYLVYWIIKLPYLGWSCTFFTCHPYPIDITS